MGISSGIGSRGRRIGQTVGLLNEGGAGTSSTGTRHSMQQQQPAISQNAQSRNAAVSAAGRPSASSSVPQQMPSTVSRSPTRGMGADELMDDAISQLPGCA